MQHLLVQESLNLASFSIRFSIRFSNLEEAFGQPLATSWWADETYFWSKILLEKIAFHQKCCKRKGIVEVHLTSLESIFLEQDLAAELGRS